MNFRNSLTPLDESQLKAVGAMIRTKRRSERFGLKRVKGWVGVSEGHLSRVEHGERQLSWAKAQILAQQLNLDPVELVAVTSRLPATVLRDLAVPGLALALVDADYHVPVSTKLILRRLAIGAEADKVSSRGRGQPDPAAMLATIGARVELVEDWTPPAIQIAQGLVRCASGPEADVRFQLAHALGHLMLQSVGCAPGAFGVDAEIEATAYACYFLAPKRLLEMELTRAPRPDLSQGEGIGALVEFVAVALKIPAWLAARRLAEESQLARVAGLAE